MENSNSQRTITFSKPHTRGDEVGTLFLAVTILCFLIISFTRFSVVGKTLDDFCFSFLFGWIKYLLYGFSLIAIVPLCFGYHLKCKLNIVGKLLVLVVLVCWTTQTLTLMINNSNHLYTNYYQLNLINITTNYANAWWNNSIFTNYNGFFGSPISFSNLSFNTFFAKDVTGGMISSILTGLFSYGFFITNVIVNIITIFLFACWLCFERPLIIVSKIKLFSSALVRKLQCAKHENKAKRFTNKQLKVNKLIHEKNRKQVLNDKTIIEKEVLKEIKDMKKQVKNTSQLYNKSLNSTANLEMVIKNKQQQILAKQQQVSTKELDTQQIPPPELIHNKSDHYFNEDSHLTPFGKINPDNQKDHVSFNKGALVIKKSLEDSVFNNNPTVSALENVTDVTTSY